MSTEPGGIIRHTTSVAPVTMAELPTIDDATDLDEAKSKVTYIWNPFDDVNLVGPDGLIMRLGKGRSYYGQGKPQETLEAYLARKGNVLQRCFMYPLWNVDYFDTVANTGDFKPADGNITGGTTPQSKLRVVERRQFAGVCAADYISRYGESHGARALTPLVGMDGPETKVAEELFKIVQPYALKLDNTYDEDDQETLLYDLTHTAKLRIAGAGFDELLAKKAEAMRVIMRGGVIQAIQSAKEGLDALDGSMADARLARPGKSRPTVTDDHLCFLMGEAPRASVARPPREESAAAAADDRLDRVTQAVSVLAENALRQQTAIPAEDAEATRQLVADMREERLAMQAERLAMAEERERLELAASQATEAAAEKEKKKK